MRAIDYDLIKQIVCGLVIKANTKLRSDVLTALKQAYLKEKSIRAKSLLNQIIENSVIANKEKLAICQDTGLPIVFVELGQGARIEGDLKSAINKGVELGYRKGYFRDSIVSNPLLRGKSKSVPAVIHIDIVKGDKLKLSVLPKGFGCENKTQLKMFNPTAGVDEIKDFIIKVVKDAGPDACPPFVVGVGVGGTADYACLLAKKALLRKITLCFRVGNIYYTRKSVVSLEKEILSEINELNIGPMGLGGKTTCLGVNIETYPTHIAGLPVVVNISCHALRSATKEI